MIKLILVGLITLSSYTYANVNAVVSILPQQTFLKAIGGDKVNIALMVKPGNSPHTYEPKPSQMKDIDKADIYFSIDVEFEKAWLPKFQNQNQNMTIINISNGIEKVEIAQHHHEEDEHNEKDGLDPHIWTSPNNVKVIAKNIFQNLVKIDKVNESYYRNNYNNFINHVEQTNKNIKNILVDIPANSKFMVLHPAWGYFAKDYRLTQIAIEANGKSPKPKQIIHIIEEAKEENVKAIFTAPEFSDKIAKQIANELGIKVIRVSPLNPNWSKSLQDLARAIANK